MITGVGSKKKKCANSVDLGDYVEENWGSSDGHPRESKLVGPRDAMSTRVETRKKLFRKRCAYEDVLRSGFCIPRPIPVRQD
jgi:hypothetical protein